MCVRPYTCVCGREDACLFAELPPALGCVGSGGEEGLEADAPGLLEPLRPPPAASPGLPEGWRALCTGGCGSRCGWRVEGDAAFLSLPVVGKFRIL